MVAITTLLGLGAITVLSVQSEMDSSGQSRFGQHALYAAESGAAAGIEFLRTGCSPTSLFSGWVTPSNATPYRPASIVGNALQPGVSGNPFDPATQQWYEVTVLNNPEDPGFAAASNNDTDGIVMLRSIGHGPDNTVATVEVEVVNNSCVALFCEQEYAQRNINGRNDASAACSARVTSGQLRSIDLGGGTSGNGGGGPPPPPPPPPPTGGGP